MYKIRDFRNWLSLNRDFILAFAPEKAGVYVVRKRNFIVYVGRSDRSLRQRLLSHVSRFNGHEFSCIQVDDKVRRFRVEHELIIEAKRLKFSQNRISAALPAGF